MRLPYFPRPRMEPKYRIHLGIIHDTLFNHVRRTTLFTQWRSFFCRLKNEFYCTREILANTGQDFCCTHKPSNMVIMPAGMHHIHFFTLINAFGFGSKRQIHFFLYRKTVHICPKRHNFARTSSF